MTTVTTRSSKGSALTHDEVDANFNNLNSDKAEAPSSSTDNAVARYDGTSGDIQDSGVTVDDSNNLTVPGNIAVTGNVDGRDVAADGTKLDGIESSATADQTDAEIETAYNNQVSVVGQSEAEAGTATTVRRWTAQRVSQAIAALTAAATPTVLFKSANYTITADDVDAPMAVVYADASGGNITNIQLPTVANLNGKIAMVIAETDPGTNTIIVNESDGSTEIATLVEIHDFFMVTSDGSAYKPMDWKNGHYARVYVNADESVAQGASEQITSISEDTDTGGIWNTSNDEVDIPFDCWIDFHWHPMQAASAISGWVIAEAKLDTTYVIDGTAVGTDTLPKVAMPLSGRIKAASGQKLELWARNIESDQANSVAGDAAGDESFATIKLTRIY